jgi:hypothetical protein
MAGDAEELARLQRRIADVRRAIEQARHRRGWSGLMLAWASMTGSVGAAAALEASTGERSATDGQPRMSG